MSRQRYSISVVFGCGAASATLAVSCALLAAQRSQVAARCLDNAIRYLLCVRPRCRQRDAGGELRLARGAANHLALTQEATAFATVSNTGPVVAADQASALFEVR